MKSLYVNVSLTYYSNPELDVECFLYRSLPSGASEMKQIPLNEAYKLMWKIVKAGGKRTYRPNRYKPTVSMVTAEFFTTVND